MSSGCLSVAVRLRDFRFGIDPHLFPPRDAGEMKKGIERLERLERLERERRGYRLRRESQIFVQERLSDLFSPATLLYAVALSLPVSTSLTCIL